MARQVAVRGCPISVARVRASEIEAGHIDHALAFTYRYPSNTSSTRPAAQTDVAPAMTCPKASACSSTRL